MIGDSETDAESAMAANIPFILIENGYTRKKSLRNKSRLFN